MDPDEVLRRIRVSLVSMRLDVAEPAAQSLVEHVQVLDDWLSKGGFLPTAWSDAVTGR